MTSATTPPAPPAEPTASGRQIPPAPPQGSREVAEVRQRVGSRLLDGFTEWWQMPALVLAAAAVVAFVVWTYRRDAAELSRRARFGLACLRLGALAALGVALLDLQRTDEHEIVFASRVAVLVDSSASMSLVDADSKARTSPPTGSHASRLAQAIDVVFDGGLIESLSADHAVSLWRFATDAEQVGVVPRVSPPAGWPVSPPAGWPVSPPAGWPVSPPAGWRGSTIVADPGGLFTADGQETRLGDAIERVMAGNATATLAGIVLLSDGGHNAGVDPAAATALAAAAGVPIHVIGVGSEILPVSVRVADLIVPLRVFPADRFTVTAYLQPQGLEGSRVRVELGLIPAGESQAFGGPSGPPKAIDSVDVVLGTDGELVPVRFDVPGLERPGRHGLVVRVLPPAGEPAADDTADDTVQTAEIEVVDRLTHVLLMAGGPGREYQFMRNVLDRDRSFAVDVLLGTAAAGMSQDARSILPGFPAGDEPLADYDAIVAIDYDWRQLDAAARGRLERWVARESGGLLLVCGGISMDAWLADPRMTEIRGLFPLELRRPDHVGIDTPSGSELPRPLEFTREGLESEFLWLAGNRAASELAWQRFPGVHACFDGGSPKPGATVYARAVPAAARLAAGPAPAYFAGHYYGSGTVFSCGSGELWRLRSLGDGLHERLVTQLVRHVSQGRLLRGARQGRLLVDRERYPVGAAVSVRVVQPLGGRQAASVPSVQVRGPDGRTADLTLAAEAGRGDVHVGSFVATRQGRWQIDARLPGSGEELSRRIHAQLPDRELARPRMERDRLQSLATATGGRARFLTDDAWTPADTAALAAAVPDRSRRDYETGPADPLFKRRLNTVLLVCGVGFLCLEWIGRRLARLA